MHTDPIADMLTRIRNALLVKSREVAVPHSKLKYRIAQILVAEGYVASVSDPDGRMFTVTLKYGPDRQPTIQSIRRVSTPGRRVYRAAGELPHVLNGYGIAIVTTSAGLMTNRLARKRHLGGEVLCEVY